MKKFHKKATIPFEFEGVTFSLPGELPLSATLYLYDMQRKQGANEVVTSEDVRQLYAALLGEDNTARLIDELGCGQETLEEIITWYGGLLAQGKTPNPKA